MVLRTYKKMRRQDWKRSKHHETERMVAWIKVVTEGSDSGYILKVQMPGFTDELKVRCERMMMTMSMLVS